MVCHPTYLWLDIVSIDIGVEVDGLIGDMTTTGGVVS